MVFGGGWGPLCKKVRGYLGAGRGGGGRGAGCCVLVRTSLRWCFAFGGGGRGRGGGVKGAYASPCCSGGGGV